MSGWNPPNNLTTSTAHAPLGVFAPTAWMFTPQGTRHVVFQNFDFTNGDLGRLIELHANPKPHQQYDDWILNDLTARADGAPFAFGAPSGYVWSKQQSQHVVYQGLDQLQPDGHVHELWWTDNDGWNHHDLTKATDAPLALSDPFGFETKYDQTQRVVYLGRDNQLHHLYNHSGRWHHEPIGAVPSGSVARPTAYSFENQETAHVLFTTDSGHILEYRGGSKASGATWSGWIPTPNDLTMETGAPPVDPSGSAAVGYVFEGQGTQHVVYVAQASAGDANRHIIELVWDGTVGWLQTPPYNDLTAELGIIGATAGSTPACYAFEASPKQPEPTQHIFFIGADEYLHELWWNTHGWHENPLSFAGLPLAREVAAFVDVEEGTQNVFYLADTHEIIELLWFP